MAVCARSITLFEIMLRLVKDLGQHPASGHESFMQVVNIGTQIVWLAIGEPATQPQAKEAPNYEERSNLLSYKRSSCCVDLVPYKVQITLTSLLRW